MSYSAGQPTGWLNPQMAATTAPTNVVLNVTSASLAQGTYNASFQVRSTVASNSPVTMNVTLIVGPPPSIALGTTSVMFATFQGAPAQ